MIIDADSHVIESEATWAHLDPVYRSRRPIPMVAPPDTDLKSWNTFWLIDRKVRHFGATPIPGSVIAARKTYSPGCQQLTDVAERVAAMDRMKVSRQIVHPSFVLSIMTEDPDLEAALIRSYNTFMSEACARSGGRLFFNAVVPYRRPDVAVEEIRRLRKLPGMVSVLIRGLEWDRPLDHPDHYPIFEEAQRHGLPMVVHLGIGSPSMVRMFDGLVHPTTEMKTFFPPYSRRLLSTLTVQYGFYNLVEGALLKDFPGLRWAFLEGGGCTWMASAVRTAERGGKSVRPAFEAGRILVGCEPDDDIPYAAAELGAGALLVSSDMPHFDEAAHDSIGDEYEARGDLSPELLDRMFLGNAAGLFDFAKAAAPAVLSAATA